MEAAVGAGILQRGYHGSCSTSDRPQAMGPVVWFRGRARLRLLSEADRGSAQQDFGFSASGPAVSSLPCQAYHRVL